MPYVFSPQAASLPMSVIIVGVGPAEFDGKSVCGTSVSLEQMDTFQRCHLPFQLTQ